MTDKDLRLWTIQDYRAWLERVGQTRLSYWFSRIPSNLLVPQTMFVKAKCDLRVLPYGETPKGYHDFLIELGGVCRQIGFPCFLRTDLTSGKHDWLQTCYLESLNDLPNHVYKLCEHSAMANIASDGWPVDIWIVREFVPLYSTFKSFRGMPVTKERRYFVRDGKVECHHPYWPEEAFDKQRNLPDNWQILLGELNRETDEEVEQLTRQTEWAVSVLSGYWSCDWAYTQSCEWMLIDMGRGEDSYHWSSCEYS